MYLFVMTTTTIWPTGMIWDAKDRVTPSQQERAVPMGFDGGQN